MTVCSNQLFMLFIKFFVSFKSSLNQIVCLNRLITVVADDYDVYSDQIWAKHSDQVVIMKCPTTVKAAWFLAPPHPEHKENTEASEGELLRPAVYLTTFKVKSFFSEYKRILMDVSSCL